MDTTTRRSFLQFIGVTGATAALSGCDPVSESLVEFFQSESSGPFRPPRSDEIDLTTHVLNRLTFGPRPGDYERVLDMGVEAFIEEQLAFDSIDDAACDRRVASIESMYQPTAEMYEYNEGRLLLDLTRFKLMRAVYSHRQLHEVMVDFWTDHLNIVSEKGDCKWLKAADDRDVIRAHALGNFRNLIRASALSPAMLIYLDGHDNKVGAPGDRPNENYARELLELHTLGVHGGYTQQDVMEVARCLSGWTYENRPFSFSLNPFTFHGARVAFDPDRHDDGEKFVLGERIPAGGGENDLDRVLDIVCAHPSTARHVARKLCRMFIADAPPEEPISAVAASFRNSSGDIRSILRSLFETEAFMLSRGNLFKRPLRFVISALRATDAKTNCSPELIEYLQRMGHAPFQYPTPDGYPIEPDPWLGSLLWRWNFALALQWNELEGVSFDPATFASRFEGIPSAAAHLLGRRPTDEEATLLAEAKSPIALMLAGPAFQWH